MANYREARGWVVYGGAVALALPMVALRLLSGGEPVAPWLLFSFLDVPFFLAAGAVALAAAGLHQALWYSIIRKIGQARFASSILMFGAGVMLFYSMPNHVGQREVFLGQFAAALVMFAYVPALSWGSRTFTGIGIIGSAAVLGVSGWGLLEMGFDSLFQEPVLMITLGVEAALLLSLLGLMRFTMLDSQAKGTPVRS